MEAHGGYVDVRSGPGGTMVELGVPQNDPPTGEISR
jgi:nitrogen-specific signal transduction histidine kinase